MESTQERSSVTDLLDSWSRGNAQALSELMPLVYDELRKLAHGYLWRERPDHTLETSALIHEAYLRLVDQRVDCRDRSYFFAIAARTMRRILVEHARSHGYQKRGGDRRRVAFNEALTLAAAFDPDLLTLDEGLKSLETESPALTEVVELRFFGGLTAEEIAETLSISTATVTRRWRLARAWLFRYLTRGEVADG